MSFFEKVRLGFTALAVLAIVACGETEVAQGKAANLNDLPPDVTGDGPKNEAINIQEARRLQELGNALPIVGRTSCEGFSIKVSANPIARSSSTGTEHDLIYSDEPGSYSGIIVQIVAPSNFNERVLLKRLIYPDLNAEIFIRSDDGSWRNITSQGRTFDPQIGDATFTEQYLGFDPSNNSYPFVGGIYSFEVPWSQFYLRTAYHGGTAPMGRYRVSFIEKYEMEWRNGSCRFQLPDMEFDYVHG